MKSSFVSCAVLLLFAICLISPTAAINSPVCSENCLNPVLVSLPCYSNTSTSQELANCFCPNDQAQAMVSICVSAKCNSTDQYIAGKLGISWCQGQPTTSRAIDLIITVVLLVVFISIFVALRAWSRLITRYRFGWDDWTLGIATIATYAFLAIEVPNAQRGTGVHAWNLDPDNGLALRKIFYISKPFYIVAQVFTKISLVIFYLRVFPNRWIQIASWLMFAWLAGHGIVFLFLEIVQCIPIEAGWDPTIPGKCHNELTVFYLGAATSIIEDLYILILPIPCISSLNMGTGKKIMLCFAFAIGSFASIASIVRMKVLQVWAVSSDPTWDGLDFAVWSAVEIGMAVICGCLPTLRPLLSRYLPSVFSGGNSSKQITSPTTSNYPRSRDTFCLHQTNVDTLASTKERKGRGNRSSNSESTEHIDRLTSWPNDDEVMELVIMRQESAKNIELKTTEVF